MNDLISTAILIATLFGGTVAADKIYISVRRAVLEQSAKGLPKLSPFADTLTSKRHIKNLNRRRLDSVFKQQTKKFLSSEPIEACHMSITWCGDVRSYWLSRIASTVALKACMRNNRMLFTLFFGVFKALRSAWAIRIDCSCFIIKKFGCGPMPLGSVKLTTRSVILSFVQFDSAPVNRNWTKLQDFIGLRVHKWLEIYEWLNV